MMEPRCSILLPVDKAPFLEEALDTLLAQSMGNFELLVLDDASGPDAKAIIAGYALRDPRIRIIRNEVKRGLPATLNRGLFAARAPMIARADSDDRYRPDRLEKQLLRLASEPGLVALSCGHRRIDGRGRVLYQRRPLTDPALIAFHLMFHNPVLHPGAVFHREPVLRVGGYDEDFWTAQDTELWGRLSALGGIGSLSEPLVDWRIHGDTISKTRGKRGDELSMQVLRRNQERYLKRSVRLEDARAAVMVWRAQNNLSPTMLPCGLAQLTRIADEAATKEPATVLRDFQGSVSYSLRRCAVRQLFVAGPGEAARLFGQAVSWRLRPSGSVGSDVPRAAVGS